MDEITSAAFVVRKGADVVAAGGFRAWPAAVAHLCVLTAPGEGGGGLARQVASQAVRRRSPTGCCRSGGPFRCPLVKSHACWGFVSLEASSVSAWTKSSLCWASERARRHDVVPVSSGGALAHPVVSLVGARLRPRHETRWRAGERSGDHRCRAFGEGGVVGCGLRPIQSSIGALLLAAQPLRDVAIAQVCRASA